MAEPFFPNVERIAYEGPDSRNPLAFRYYDAERVVAGRTMREQLRFSVCCWHSFHSPGADVFGGGTFDRPWLEAGDAMERARSELAVAFEFFEKLGAPFFCFHDRDLAPEGDSARESNANLDCLVEAAQAEMERTGVELLWGTANLFSQSALSAAGASTNP